jgi:hypothetical protein
MQNYQFSAKGLLDHFFSACESKLRFLEQRHGFSYLSGVAEYRNNSKIIRPWHGQDVPENFLALTRYERGDLAIEILYGDKEFTVESYVYYGPVRRYALNEVLNAARKKPRGKTGNWGVTRPGLIDEMISNVALNLEAHHKTLLEPGDKLLERITTIRDMQLEQAVRRHFAETIKTLSMLAAKAYRERDYRQVVEMLEPYKEYLPSAELKKLQLAKKQLLS